MTADEVISTTFLNIEHSSSPLFSLEGDTNAAGFSSNCGSGLPLLMRVDNSV
jgi:hypothetical protein